MRIAELVGQTLAECGVRQVFGVAGSGNFHATNALCAAGARYVAASHEAGAATMADAYARLSGRPGVLSVHQGPGLTNALTGVTEAAKSGTPLLVLAPETTAPQSNFYLDLPGLADAVGAGFHRLSTTSPRRDVLHAFQAAARGATVLLGMPLQVQAADAAAGPTAAAGAATASQPAPVSRPAPADQSAPIRVAPPDDQQVAALAEAIRRADRPVFIAGRGAARQPAEPARVALTALADRCGALLAVSAAAKGLFAGDPWYLDIVGGFASPLAAELVSGADLVVAWGSTLNMWTTRHGRLLPAGAAVVQVDHDPAALGIHRPITHGVRGDVTEVARAVTDALGDWRAPGWRTPSLATRIAGQAAWRHVLYRDESSAEAIDPRTLSIALDDALPDERTVAVDSGNFMGYPSMYLAVPDATGFCFTQGFQSVGLGLASAIGAAIARPDRLTVAALGDGGFLMSAVELVTAVRQRLPLLVVIYNDAGYGAEVHHFGPAGHPLATVTYPDPDLAAIGRGYGCAGVTVRTLADLVPVRQWLAGPREQPLVVDAKVSSSRGAWWLEEAFRGH